MKKSRIRLLRPLTSDTPPPPHCEPPFPTRGGGVAKGPGAPASSLRRPRLGRWKHYRSRWSTLERSVPQQTERSLRTGTPRDFSLNAQPQGKVWALRVLRE